MRDGSSSGCRRSTRGYDPTRRLSGVAPSPAGDELEPRFRQAFRRQAGGVAVITYLDGARRPCGVTATAVSSVSASPPRLLVCLHRASRSRDEIVHAGRFGVNMLALPQREIADHCSRPGGDKVLPPAWLLADAAPRATPVLEAALTHCECAVGPIYEVETHSIVIGRVEDIWLGRLDEPLVYFDGTYSTLDRSPEKSLQAMWDAFESAYWNL